MTTQPPRFGTYPTAPPWATTDQTPAATPPSPEPFIATTFPPAPTPVIEPAPLLAPGELTPPAAATAAPAQPAANPPSVIPIALLTCLFSVLGAIPAAKRADAAARDGHPRNPYWITFAMAMVVNTLFLTSVAMLFLLPDGLR